MESKQPLGNHKAAVRRHIGAKIDRAARARGVSIAAIARELGIHKTTLYRMLRGLAHIDGADLHIIGCLLNVPTAWFLPTETFKGDRERLVPPDDEKEGEGE